MIRPLVRRLAEHERGRRLLCAGVDLFDRTVCTPEAVKRQASEKARRARQTFSVAIAHFNRGSLIHLPLFNLLNHPAVEDVVIVDDGSDKAQFDALLRSVDHTGAGDRIRVHRRERNLGALATKAEAVSLAKRDWVLVLDSDNTAFRGYLDALSQAELSPDTFYCASRAFPFFDFAEFQGRRIDFNRCCQWVSSGVLRRSSLINDGNYLVPRKHYGDAVESLGSPGKDGADVMLVNYRWLTSGGSLQVTTRSVYLHRLGNESLYRATQSESRGRILEMFRRLDQALPCSSDFIAGLQTAVAPRVRTITE